MAVTINITKDEHSFIDGATGEELTQEQFNQRLIGSDVGGLTAILSRGKPATAEEEDKAE